MLLVLCISDDEFRDFEDFVEDVVHVLDFAEVSGDFGFRCRIPVIEVRQN